MQAHQDEVANHTAYTNRRAAPGSQPAWPFFDAILKTLKAQIKAIEKALKALVNGHAKLRKAVKNLYAIK